MTGHCDVNRHPLPRSAIVQRDPEILGGVPVFAATRVPVRTLSDYLKRGHTLDEFLDDFPSVSRAQALAVIEAEPELSEAGARPAR
jgi:uncharacterized protein (DUF433 family)